MCIVCRWISLGCGCSELRFVHCWYVCRQHWTCELRHMCRWKILLHGRSVVLIMCSVNIQRCWCCIVHFLSTRRILIRRCIELQSLCSWILRC